MEEIVAAGSVQTEFRNRAIFSDRRTQSSDLCLEHVTQTKQQRRRGLPRPFTERRRSGVHFGLHRFSDQREHAEFSHLAKTDRRRQS